MNIVHLTSGTKTLIVPLERIAKVTVQVATKRTNWFKLEPCVHIELGLVMPEEYECVEGVEVEAGTKFIEEISGFLYNNRGLYSETYNTP